jgi:hypothetical protein
MKFHGIPSESHGDPGLHDGLTVLQPRAMTCDDHWRSHGATPIAGWFTMENPHGKTHDLGVPP